ncbi:MAG: LysE family translocator [Brevundimonas sp.]
MWIDPSVFGPFLAAALLMELTPGPNMGWLALVAMGRGRRAGLSAVAGVTLGLAAWMLAAAAGLAQVLASAPTLYRALAWAGVAFMVYLAWEAWREPVRDAPEDSPEMSGGLFLRGLVGNLLNPKAAVLYATVLPAFAVSGGALTPGRILALGLAHLIVSVVVHGAIVLTGAAAGDRLVRVLSGRRSRLLMSGALLLIALWLGWQTFR